MSDQLIKQFRELQRRKIELKNYKHKGNELNFKYCLDHLIEEFKELEIAVKEGDEAHIAEELADLANMCEITFLCLKLRAGLGLG